MQCHLVYITVGKVMATIYVLTFSNVAPSSHLINFLTAMS